MEDSLHGGRIGQCERILCLGRGGRRCLLSGERLLDRDGPLVPLVLLPDHHHEAPSRAKRPGDIGECGERVEEEHRSEPADGDVEAFRRKAVDLHIGLLERDVA
jgi:hypothetical protein